MTKKPKKTGKISKNPRYFCWNCNGIYEDIDKSDKSKACPRCKTKKLGKIIE
jgi:DNA-directed RNA polymerase subunit RPC12/RpoP